MRLPTTAAHRAVLTLLGGAVLAVVFGFIGYQFRADAVGVFMGVVLGSAPVIVVGFVAEYFLAERRDGD